MHCDPCFFTGKPRGDVGAGSSTVCQRCARNFTRLELGQVIGLTALYLVICRFSYYLVAGEFFAGPWKGSFVLGLDLSRWLEFPVPVGEYPWHLVSMGLVLTLVATVPALAGLFFGARSGVAVALAGGLFAGVPWLFAVTVPSAYLAARRFNGKLGLDTTLLAAVGLPLALVVAVTAAGLGRSPAIVLALWALMLGFTGALVWPVLYLARRRDWSGGTVLRAVGTAAVATLALFWVTVGFDTVEYAFLRSRAWTLGPRFAGLLGVDQCTQSRADLAELVRRHTEELEPVRRRSIEEFDGFVSLFPRSRFTSWALFEMAELHNMKLRLALAAPVNFRVYTERITPQAADLYRRIVDEFTDSVPAMRARLRLADCAAQQGRIDEAVTRYDETRNLYLVRSANYAPPQPMEDAELVCRTHRPDPERFLRACHQTVREADERLDFIRRNRDFNDMPLVLYLEADPASLSFMDDVGAVLTWFPGSALEDNILWDRALRTNLHTEDLERILARYPAGDVAPRVLLHLTARAAAAEPPAKETARKYLERLLTEFSDSAEAAHARRELGAQFPELTSSGRKANGP